MKSQFIKTCYHHPCLCITIYLLITFTAGLTEVSASHFATKLRCEYKNSPIGIDDRVPRLSWIMKSEERGSRQTAYQILVSSSQKGLVANKGDLWDSGKVISDDSIQIDYFGKPLQSRMFCFWKVRTWNQHNEVSPWSSSSFWSMGLLKRDDWKAQWISHDTSSEIEDPTYHIPPSPMLRKEFSSKRGIKRATLYISALGLFEAYLNGKRIGKDHFTPGWSNYNKRVFYLTYDVTSYIARGKNCLTVNLADGWYAGYVGFSTTHKQPMKNYNLYGDTSALLLQLEILNDNGEKSTITSDSSWKATTGPIRSSDMQMGETYDARRYGLDRQKVGYNDTGWPHVQIKMVGTPPHLQAYPANPVQKFQTLDPIEITEPKKNVYVFNFGQNIAGRTRLKLKGKKGAIVRLRFAEMLHDDGTVMTENLRSARSTDHYIFKGSGEYEEWEPTFTYHGFQYVEMTGLTEKPDNTSLQAVVLHSAAPEVGSFSSSDSLTDKLYNNILWTQRSNFFDIPTDCPQRDERLGWTGDAQIFMKSALYNMDLGAFYKKWLINLFDDQRPSGAFPDFAPLPFLQFEPSPGWMDAGIICPYELYKAYNDTRSIKKYYDQMKRFITHLTETSTNYIRTPLGNNWGDWQAIKAYTPRQVIATAYYAYDVKLMAEMAAAIGKEDDSNEFNTLYTKIKKAFNQQLIDTQGQIMGDTQTGYALALYMGLLEAPHKKTAQKRLVELIKKRNYHLSTGFLGLKHLLPALSKSGESTTAYKLFQQKSFPSWGYSIVNGATTIWERWNSYTLSGGFANPGMNSFNHYAFGSVLEWMYSYLAGIEAAKPGYKEIVIRPQIGDLSIKRIAASYDSIYGKISSKWEIKDDKYFLLKVSIPPNTQATILLPTIDSQSITEGSDPLDKAPGIIHKSFKENYAIIKVASGNYSFQSLVGDKMFQ